VSGVSPLFTHCVRHEKSFVQNSFSSENTTGGQQRRFNRHSEQKLNLAP
jgi:hypothetical protein